MLTPAEKAAGRRFRDAERARRAEALAAAPPTWVVPGVLAVIRHLCPARHGQSSALELRERYVPSPSAGGDVPAGRFAWIWREGRCRGCGQTAASEGRLVDGWARAPIHGRVARS